MPVSTPSERAALFAAGEMTPERGFLPPEDPTLTLPADYAPWDDLARDLPALLAAGQARAAIAALPTLPVVDLATDGARRRAMVLLSHFGHAHVFGGPPLLAEIPAPVAVPWHALAATLGRPPILSYASHILDNWRRIDPAGPVALENLARAVRFLGGMDEDWFGMVHIAIEACAAPAISAAAEAQDAALAGDAPAARDHLVAIVATLEAVTALLNRLPERCDPYIYYQRVRPFLAGWLDNPDFPAGVVYAGVAAYGGQPQRFRGASGAQSAIIPAIDAALGIDLHGDAFGAYLRSLETAMPPGHRRFLARLRRRAGLRAFVLARRDRDLVEAYNAAINASHQFRVDHLRFAAAYIQAQVPRGATGEAVGTGGTPFMRYLKQHAKLIEQYLVAP